MNKINLGYNERVLGCSCVVEALPQGFFRVICEDGRNDVLRAVGSQKFCVGDVGRTVYYSDGQSYGLTRFDADPSVEFDFEKAKKNYPYGWKSGWPIGHREYTLVDAYSIDNQTAVYTVSLEPGCMVDVKVCGSGLVYVMQNNDGSTVYREANDEVTIPDYKYDELAVVNFVRGEHIRRNRLSLSSLNEQIQAASSCASQLHSIDKAPAKESVPER